MNKPLDSPILTTEGVNFTVVVDSIKRDCMITTQALHKLGTFNDDASDTDAMEIFKAFEATINGVARRLVAAGVAGSPLILRPETFGPPRAR